MRVPILAIHGGAGAIARDAPGASHEAAYRAALSAVLLAGQALLREGGSALDAVTEAVRLLEDCELFNAGKGAVYTQAGAHELDASVMDGATLAAGAVANVGRIRNPVLAARAVMECSEHILLVGSGAEDFARRQGVVLVDPGYFHTDARYRQWLRVRGLNGGAPIDPDGECGTVGAVALDAQGNLAAAASTGGVTNKRPGRVGDTAIIGAGCYASNRTAAVSATGVGEAFMRTVAAYDVAARIAYAGATLQQAAYQVIMELLPAHQGRGGLIALDAQGKLALPFNTEGMYRGYVRGGEAPVTAIHR